MRGVTGVTMRLMDMETGQNSSREPSGDETATRAEGELSVPRTGPAQLGGHKNPDRRERV